MAESSTPFHMHLAILHRIAHAIDEIGGLHVALGEVIDGGGEEGIPAHRLILDAGLILLAFRGLEGRAAERRRHVADHRLEGGGIAHIRRDAVVKQIGQARAPGGGAVVLILRGQAVIGEGGRIGAGPVLPHAQRQQPAVELDLVLRIEAQLVHRAVDLGRIPDGIADILVIERREDIDGRRGAEGGEGIGVEVPIVRTDQDVVAQRTRGELRLELVCRW